jgi:hypothetical protein
MPLGVSAIRGVGLPALGLSIIDFVTTAPISRSGKNCDNSFPDEAQPLAVNIGEGNQAPPNVVPKSKLIIVYLLMAIEPLPHP